MNYLDKFAPILEKGETVKWTGRPEPFKVMEEYNKKALLLRWILTPVIAAGLLIWYIIYTANAPDVSFSWVILIAILAVAAFLILRPFTDARTLMKKRIYAVTNQRLLIYENDSTHHAMNLDEINEVKFISKEKGLSDVIFGEEAVRKSYGRTRITAIVPIKGMGDKENQILGMAFYNIKDADKIKPLLAAGTKVTQGKL